jgi:aspartate kinase
MAFLGAKVLHPQTVEPARTAGIPIHICNFLQPNLNGTVISQTGKQETGSVTSVVYQSPLELLLIQSDRRLSRYDFLNAVFEVIDRERVSPLVTTVSENRIAFGIRPGENMELLVGDLNRVGSVRRIQGKASISLVGDDLCLNRETATSLFRHIGDRRVDMISYGASPHVFTLVVEEEDVSSLVNRFHHLCIGEPAQMNE